MADGFDVFLSYNREDGPAVQQLRASLEARGVRPWLYEWEVRPGDRWQEELARVLRKVSAVAVVIGPRGLGPWQKREMRAALREAERRVMRVIPVLLPGAPDDPDLDLFLEEHSWADLRVGLTENGLASLIFGITGQRPEPSSVAANWQTSFERLSPATAAALRLAAHLAPEPIPERIFEGEGDKVFGEATGLVAQETRQQPASQRIVEALAELAAHALITHRGPMFMVDRQVQEAVRLRIPEERRRDWVRLALELVSGFAPEIPVDTRTWPVWDLLRPHAEQVIAHADQAGIREVTFLMNHLGAMLWARGLYAEAEPLMRRALDIDEAAFGRNHPDVVSHLSNLAQLFLATNRPAEAEPLMRRALSIDQEAFGQDHPDVARDLNNLAGLLQATNRLAEAETLMQRALSIDREAFGQDHPTVARDLNNLAGMLQATNRLAGAEPLMRRALDLDQAAFGQDHPEVARGLNNLAQLLRETDRLAEAEPLMRRALEIDQAAFGQDHPEVARALNNLALLLKDTNRLAEAEPLMRQALDIFKRSLGPEHPSARNVHGNLAALLLQKAETHEP